RADPCGDLGDGRVHITHERRLPALGVLLAGDADVQHDRAGLDVLGTDQVGDARGGDDDIGAAQVRGQVDGAGVGEGDGRVDRAAGHERADGTAHGDAAPDDDHVLALEVQVVTQQQLDHGAGRAGQRGVDRRV